MTPRTDEHALIVDGANPQPEHSATNLATVRLRNAFTINSHRSIDGHEHHMITAPKHGPDRAQARRAILAVLHHAQKLHHRVSFLLKFGDYTQQPLNIQRGYDANVALLQCRIHHDDPYAWLQRQLLRTSPTTDTNSIIGVNIHTWPDPSSSNASKPGTKRVVVTGLFQSPISNR